MQRSSERRGTPLVYLCLIGLAAAGGCGRKLVEVSGKATVDGEPLTKAVVFFAPDKDNPLRTIPRGTVDENGVYQLETDGEAGVPLGWYRVYIAFESGRQTNGNQSPFWRTIHPKYLSAAKSPFSLEVVATPQPGAYDLKMTKR